MQRSISIFLSLYADLTMNTAQKLLLNCDLGETEKLTPDSIEHTVMPIIDMANIACGFHAGNTQVMKACIELALEHDVKIGAHPSYPDRENFGRVSMALNTADIADLMYQQLRTIDAIADDCGTKLDYVKPHGALYNDMMLSDAVLQGVLQAVKLLDPTLPIMVMATPQNDKFAARAQAMGLTLIFEAFADRRYTDKGLLETRQNDGAVFTQENHILEQVSGLASHQTVETNTGQTVNIVASALCVHGDNEQSVSLIKKIKQALT